MTQPPEDILNKGRNFEEVKRLYRAMAAYEETYKVYLHPVRDEWGLLLSLEAISSEKDTEQNSDF